VIEPQLTEAVIPTSVLAAVVELGQQQGCAIDRWLAGTGFTPPQLADPHVKASFRQAATVLRRALRDLPAGPVGLQLGGRDALVSFGMLGMAMRSCGTGAEALALGVELQLASGALTDVTTEVTGDEVGFVLRERSPEPELLPFLCEESFGSILRLTWAIFGVGNNPVRLELTYPAPVYAAEYRRFFGCPVRFRADANRLSMSADLLRTPIATRDPASRALAEDACLRLLDTGEAPHDIIRTVEALLNENLRTPLTMADVADRLSVTERTLRRQLAAAGVRFSDVRDRVRERRATYLIESGLPVTAIAREVGFGDVREFRRAYIRWTGQPPSAARRQHSAHRARMVSADG